MRQPQINPMQAMLDAMSAEWKKERAGRQMTLGALIDVLAELPSDATVAGLGRLDSYRGYYEDLAFIPSDEERAVGDVLEECRSAMGRTFTGYKGGDYLMGEDTPLWVSAWGTASGDQLMGLAVESDPIIPITEDEVWDHEGEE